MHKMDHATSPCVVCGMGNIRRNDGTMPVFVDFERDVNWNDPVVMCEDCITKAGALVGLLSGEERRDLERTIKERDAKIHELEAEATELERRARQAIKRARAAV